MNVVHKYTLIKWRKIKYIHYCKHINCTIISISSTLSVSTGLSFYTSQSMQTVTHIALQMVEILFKKLIIRFLTWQRATDETKKCLLTPLVSEQNPYNVSTPPPRVIALIGQFAAAMEVRKPANCVCWKSWGSSAQITGKHAPRIWVGGAPQYQNYYNSLAYPCKPPLNLRKKFVLCVCKIYSPSPALMFMKSIILYRKTSEIVR